MERNKQRQAGQILMENGLYRTRSRLAILGVFLDAKKPLGQPEIARVLAKGNPDKVTIYRTLEAFCEAGIVHRAYTHERTAYFELAHNCSSNQCHPHFTCRSCGNVECLVDAKLPMVKGVGKGFVVQRQQVRLEGLCPVCSEK